MTEHAGIWLFWAFNMVLLVVGGALTVISFRTYLQHGELAYKLPAFAFAVITIGAFSESTYSLYDL